jgi:hypothetical protein
MDEPKKQPSSNFSAFKPLVDDTKNPPQLRRPTLDEAYMLVDGRARQQGFFLVAEALGVLIYGTWDNIKAARQARKKKTDQANQT